MRTVPPRWSVSATPAELAAADADEPGAAISVGCEVRIRLVREPGMDPLPPGIKGGKRDQVVALVEHGQGGLYRLEPRTPLGRALLGHRARDVVPVTVQAGTVTYVVLAVEPLARTMSEDAGVAEQADAALLKSALPLGGPGSSPGARTIQAAENGQVIQVGDVVDVQDGDLREWWRIVPHCDADAMRRRVSEMSPLARALLGRQAGDVVRVRAPEEPGGGRAITILAVTRPGTK